MIPISLWCQERKQEEKEAYDEEIFMVHFYIVHDFSVGNGGSSKDDNGIVQVR